MKRDMELIRKILFEIEDKCDNTVYYDLEIEGYTTEQVAYHCSILYEGDYIHDYDAQYGSGEIQCFGVSRLTWEGHNYLDNIRDDTIWNQTVSVITNKGLPFVFSVVKSVATNLISSMINAV